MPVGEADADEGDEIEEAGHAQQGVEPTLVLHTPRNMEIRPRRGSALNKPVLWVRSVFNADADPYPYPVLDPDPGWVTKLVKFYSRN